MASFQALSVTDYTFKSPQVSGAEDALLCLSYFALLFPRYF
jgi:hypothetical protein